MRDDVLTPDYEQRPRPRRRRSIEWRMLLEILLNRKVAAS